MQSLATPVTLFRKVSDSLCLPTLCVKDTGVVCPFPSFVRGLTSRNLLPVVCSEGNVSPMDFAHEDQTQPFEIPALFPRDKTVKGITLNAREETKSNWSIIK